MSEEIKKELNSFEKLNNIDLTDKIKEKIGLKYLSWAYAWGELKKAYPDAFYTIYKRTVKSTITSKVIDNGAEIVTVTEDSNEIPYFTDGKTCYVKVGVTVGGIEYVELLPVMDNRNNSVPVSVIKMTDVNKAIQRAFVKACARHGLGLYIYAGEDLPEVNRKEINYRAIADNCDKYQTVVLNQVGFDKMKEDVIKAVQDKYPEDASKAIVDYVVKITNGKRLSMFTLADDSQNLQRISYFINEVKKELAAPVSGN